MKIADVKKLIDKYPEKQLKLVITEIYKVIPKAIKESRNIDAIISDPDKHVAARKIKKRPQIPDIKSLRVDTEKFIEYAKNQFYCSPNKFVSKKKRSQWRFVVKRLDKELFYSAQNENNLSMATELLEDLYNLMCYSCKYIIFNSYDSFESIGIEQKEFFTRVLFLKFQIEPKRIFINNALKLMLENSVNRYTLYSDLIHVILSYLKTNDMIEIAIDQTNQLLEIEKDKQITKLKNEYSEYEKQKNINNLAEFGFFCYVKLFEIQNAVTFYKQHCIESNREIALYVLLRLLFSIGEKEYFLQEYKNAIDSGIKPRQELRKMYIFTKKSGQLPQHFGWVV
jgi:hypothetical protein